MGAITKKDVEKATLKARATGSRVRIKDSDGSGKKEMPEPGLTLIVGPTGTARWTYAYRPRGNDADGKRHAQKWATVGRPELMSVAEARAEVRQLKAAIADGRDPLADKKAAERLAMIETARAVTLRAAAAEFLDLKAKGLSKASAYASEATQVTLAVRELQEIAGVSLLAAEATPVMVRKVLDLHAGKPATVRQRRGAMIRLFQHCVAYGYLTENPASGTEAPKAPSERTWKPSASEVQSIWRAAEVIGGDRGRFVQAILVCPMRASEMASITVENIRGAEIVMQGMKMKNGDDFVMPIPAGFEELVAPFDTFDLKALRTRVKKLSGLERYGFHASRKLFASELAEHAIGSSDVVDPLLNHRQSATLTGVKAAYHQAGLRSQKRYLMDAWGRLLAHAVEHGLWPRDIEQGDKVVEIRHG